MYETMDENFLPCDDYMLRFSERWLLLRRTEKQVLLVLGGDKANVASTRMVTNMTLKHLTPAMLAGLESTARAAAPAGGAPAPTTNAAPAPSTVRYPAVPPPAAAKPAVEAGPAQADEAPARPVRMYRGRPY
jgi:hypothetical protein